MRITTENIKIKDGDRWIPFLGVNSGDTVLYSIRRNEQGDLELVGSDGSVSSLPIASLNIGEHTYNGSKEVNIEIYDGEVNEEGTVTRAMRSSSSSDNMTMINSTQELHMNTNDDKQMTIT